MSGSEPTMTKRASLTLSNKNRKGHLKKKKVEVDLDDGVEKDYSRFLRDDLFAGKVMLDELRDGGEACSLEAVLTLVRVYVFVCECVDSMCAFLCVCIYIRLPAG